VMLLRTSSRGRRPSGAASLAVTLSISSAPKVRVTARAWGRVANIRRGESRERHGLHIVVSGGRPEQFPA
jgi:Na+-transporting NADH:ubiquinone oxidoreductase subunit NqrA